MAVQARRQPHDIAELRKAMAQFAKGVTSYEAEFRIIRPDGEIRWCVGTAAATVDKGGRVVRVSGVTVDITERKLAEERQNLLARRLPKGQPLQPRTRHHYERIIATRLEPELGAMPLVAITPEVVRAWFSRQDAKAQTIGEPV